MCYDLEASWQHDGFAGIQGLCDDSAFAVALVVFFTYIPSLTLSIYCMHSFPSP
jgi:hypothetical protein